MKTDFEIIQKTAKLATNLNQFASVDLVALTLHKMHSEIDLLEARTFTAKNIQCSKRLRDSYAQYLGLKIED